MSHRLMKRPTVLLTVGVYSSNHGVLYTIGNSMTRKLQQSICLSVCSANKNVNSIINSRVIIHISDEGILDSLKDSEVIFLKKVCFKIFTKLKKKNTFLLTTLALLAVE